MLPLHGERTTNPPGHLAGLAEGDFFGVPLDQIEDRALKVIQSGKYTYEEMGQEVGWSGEVVRIKFATLPLLPPYFELLARPAMEVQHISELSSSREPKEQYFNPQMAVAEYSPDISQTDSPELPPQIDHGRFHFRLLDGWQTDDDFYRSYLERHERAEDFRGYSNYIRKNSPFGFSSPKDRPRDRNQIVFRGMSFEEYQFLQSHSYLESAGAGNFQSQMGYTFFSPRLQTAISYASSFALPQSKPTPERPCYVVAVREEGGQWGDHHESVPAESDEYVFWGRLSADQVVGVMQGEVYQTQEAHFRLELDEGRNPQYWRHSGQLTPDIGVGWKELL
jgi:hypothetical protein